MARTLLGKPVFGGLTIYGRPILNDYTDALGYPVFGAVSGGETIVQIAGASATLSEGAGVWAIRLLSAGSSNTLAQGQGGLVIRLVINGASATSTEGLGTVVLRPLLEGLSDTASYGSGPLTIRLPIDGASATLSVGAGLVIERILLPQGASDSLTEGSVSGAEALRIELEGISQTLSDGASTNEPIIHISLSGDSVTVSSNDGVVTVTLTASGYSITSTKGEGTEGIEGSFRTTELAADNRLSSPSPLSRTSTFECSVRRTDLAILGRRTDLEVTV